MLLRPTRCQVQVRSPSGCAGQPPFARAPASPHCSCWAAVDPRRSGGNQERRRVAGKRLTRRRVKGKRQAAKDQPTHPAHPLCGCDAENCESYKKGEEDDQSDETDVGDSREVAKIDRDCLSDIVEDGFAFRGWTPITYCCASQFWNSAAFATVNAEPMKKKGSDFAPREFEAKMDQLQNRWSRLRSAKATTTGPGRFDTARYRAFRRRRPRGQHGRQVGAAMLKEEVDEEDVRASSPWISIPVSKMLEGEDQESGQHGRTAAPSAWYGAGFRAGARRPTRSGVTGQVLIIPGARSAPHLPRPNGHG